MTATIFFQGRLDNEELSRENRRIRAHKALWRLPVHESTLNDLSLLFIFVYVGSFRLTVLP